MRKNKFENHKPVEDNPGWFRDPQSGAVVRIDNRAREKYQKQKDKINKRKQVEVDREQRLSNVEDKLDYLTQLLEKTLEKDKD